MTKPQAAVTLAALVVIPLTYKVVQIEKDMKKRFPQVDPSTRRKAYLIFLKNSANQKYGDMTDFTLEQMDKLFMDIVNEITPSK